MPPSIAPGRRLWRDCLSVGCLLSLISSAAAQNRQPALAMEAPAPRADVEVKVENGLITLHADGAPLAEVLQAIGQAGSFRVVLRGGFATPVHESFTDQPLEDAVRGLVEGHSSVILHADPGSPSSTPALAEIRVIENPALAVTDDAAIEKTRQEGSDVVEIDPADDPPLDREAFRRANLSVPPPTREAILFELGDPDRAARVAAVPKVGSLPPRDAIGILSGVLTAEGDPRVRSRAVAALTRLADPGARGLLRERALQDDDAGLRMQALSALASSSGERAVNVIAQVLRQDPEPKVRITAIRALGRVGGDWARSQLERAARGVDPKISLAAEQALSAWPAWLD